MNGKRKTRKGCRWYLDFEGRPPRLRLFQQRRVSCLAEPGLCGDLLWEKEPLGHPHPDTVERLSGCGSQILQTKESGAIIWKTDGHRINMERLETSPGRVMPNCVTRNKTAVKRKITCKQRKIMLWYMVGIS